MKDQFKKHSDSVRSAEELQEAFFFWGCGAKAGPIGIYKESLNDVRGAGAGVVGIPSN